MPEWKPLGFSNLIQSDFDYGCRPIAYDCYLFLDLARCDITLTDFKGSNLAKLCLEFWLLCPNNSLNFCLIFSTYVKNLPNALSQ